MTLLADPTNAAYSDVDDNEFYLAVFEHVLKDPRTKRTDVAKKLSVDPSYLSKWMNRHQRISSKFYPAIRSAFPNECLKVANLLRKEGVSYEAGADLLPDFDLRETEPEPSPTKRQPYVQIPIVSSVYCAEHDWEPSLTDAIDMANWTGEVTFVPNDGRRYLALRAVGRSGEPDIQHGDIIICHVDTNIRDCMDRTVIAVYDDEHGSEQVVCKRLIDHMPAHITLESLNDDYATFTVPLREVRKIWRVHQVNRMH